MDIWVLDLVVSLVMGTPAVSCNLALCLTDSAFPGHINFPFVGKKFLIFKQM